MVLSIVEATAKRNAASGFFVLNVYKIDKQKTFSWETKAGVRICQKIYLIGNVNSRDKLTSSFYSPNWGTLHTGLSVIADLCCEFVHLLAFFYRSI